MVFATGDTLTVEPDNAPGCHVYVVAPLAVNVAELPEQMVEELADTVTVGTELTVTTTVLGAAGQLAADDPFNVYVVVEAGDTLMVEFVTPPGLQV